MKEEAGETRIDGVLERLLRGSPSVRQRLLERVGLVAAIAVTKVDVIRNEFHGEGVNRGEDDLRLVLDGHPAVLIENKYNAAFTERQGWRYRERASAIMASRPERNVRLVLTGTEGFLRRRRFHPEAAFFDQHVALEEWLAWVTEACLRGEPLAAERLTLEALIGDWNAGAFQGVKGHYPKVHEAIWRLLGEIDGWYQEDANAGDWVHLHHAMAEEVKFHYRIEKRQVSVEVRRRDSRFTSDTLENARHRGWQPTSERVVVMQLMRAKAGESNSDLSTQAAERAVDALNRLMNWARRSARVAASKPS